MKTKFLIPLLAGVALLCACKGKTGSYEVVNNSGSTADSAKIDTTTTSRPRLVKTAGIRFKVKDVQQTAELISALVVSVNGMVMHHRMVSEAGQSLDIHTSIDSVMRVTAFNTVADMTVQVPSAKLEDFMNKATHLGIYINNLNMDITDMSSEYLSAALKLRNRLEIVSQQKKGSVVIKDPAKVLLLKDDMVDQQISNREIDGAVKNSIVSLSFYENNTIKKEIMANDDPAAYNLSFFKRLGMAIENGWGMFEDVFIGIANLWVFILAGIAIWMAIKQYKTKVLAKV